MTPPCSDMVVPAARVTGRVLVNKMARRSGVRRAPGDLARDYEPGSSITGLELGRATTWDERRACFTPVPAVSIVRESSR